MASSRDSAWLSQRLLHPALGNEHNLKTPVLFTHSFQWGKEVSHTYSKASQCRLTHVLPSDLRSQVSCRKDSRCSLYDAHINSRIPRSHFPTVCQYHMMCSSQKGLQRAKQITQMEIMTTLIKQWHHHPAFNTLCQVKPLNISYLSLELRKPGMCRQCAIFLKITTSLQLSLSHWAFIITRPLLNEEGRSQQWGKPPKRLYEC